MLIRIQRREDEDASIVINSNDILSIRQIARLGDDLPDFRIYLASTIHSIEIDAMQFVELTQVLEMPYIRLPEI